MARIQLYGEVLRGGVGRRVFLLFVGCSLFPVLFFAAFALVRVSRELEVQADRQMMRMAGSATVDLRERLSFAHDRLLDIGRTVAGSHFRDQDSYVAGPAGYVMEPSEATSAAERFEAVLIWDVTGHQHVVIGESFDPPYLDDLAEARLRSGQAVIRATDASEVGRRLVLFVPIGDTGLTALGAISPSFLWPEEGTNGPSGNEGRLCLDANGTPLLSSGGMTGGPLSPSSLVGTDTTQRLTWSARGEQWVGRSWRLPLEYEYGVDWTVVVFAPQAAVLAPTRSFRTAFLLTSLFGVLLVVSLSMHQIERLITPIAGLRDATQRLMASELDARVDIQTGDEFEELGKSFNVMAENLERQARTRRCLVDLGIELAAEEEEERLLGALLRGVRTTIGCSGAAVALVDEEERIDSLRILTEDETRSVPSSHLAGRMISGLRDETSIGRLVERDVASFLDFLLADHEGYPIGILIALDIPKDDGAAPLQFGVEQIQIGRILAAQASSALAQKRLGQSFKDLFDGMSRMIAVAIDEKSPHTHGHCSRVPIATMMLADAASNATEGPYADFHLTPERRYELEIAALLHDCGKVTTPVHVIDKATKLETIMDRIHVVRDRLEIVARDEEIRALRDRLHRDSDKSSTSSTWNDQLAEDLSFLERVNRGSEFLIPDDEKRIRDIAARYRFRDREGITRSVLDDVDLQNLEVKKGTLNAAERQIIEDHARTSIRMLEMLPYPRNLDRVPLIAGAHHERMDGNGYPNRIKIGTLPLEARILALADVFEALTASDRPYKRAMKLSEALRIMAFMKEEGHLDPVLFEFFVTEGIHLEYAEAHVAPHQIDEVDISSLPGCSHLVARRTAA
ncbi:MAG: HAMP domain-containing protein [Candidatus Eisenbacteria bacterium]|uniref:HAMP domain-containing protein n=1 Tax=Eiseniibacteriota bacterium TaxID=2212470 RepID=A0A956NHK2_UNCEI|nr:HAMP domain-containing protein [Candidatus Eisenbacteria bacterium]